MKTPSRTLLLVVCLSSLNALNCSMAQPSVNVSSNPRNALSTIVDFVLPGATSARVVSTSSTETLTTPYVSVDDTGAAEIAVLGLAPNTSYSHVVEAGPADALDPLDPVFFTTGPLPDELSSARMDLTSISGQAPAPGYLLVSGAGNDVFAVDSTGAVRWYCGFTQPVGEAKMQTDGSLTAYVGGSNGWQLVDGSYIRMTPDGQTMAEYRPASPDSTEADAPTVYTDPHELLITSDAAGEHIHLFGYEQRLLADGVTLGTWHQLLRQRPTGEVEFRWKSWSYFTESDTIENVGSGVVDVDHSNSIAIDPSDGNYVLSFRDTDAVLKVDANSGEVLWQLGGKRNQFAILGDPLGGFQGQHSARVLGNGNLLLYDDGLGHDPPESRAVEYKLDLEAETATLVWQYRHTPPIFTPVVGSVERLASGNTLVAFAQAGTVDEVDPGGNLVWEGQLNSSGAALVAYRIRRQPSLYAYEPP